MDRAKVRGVREGRKNRKRQERTRAPRGVLSITGKLACIAVIAGGAVYGSYGLYRFATASERFAIQDVVVTGHVRATADSIAKLSGATPGQNIFDLDLLRMKRSIEAHPWVKSAKVTRSFPRTVEIEVVEHEPRVLVALGHLYYADENGEVVKRYAPGEREALPVVTGLTREQIETDDGETRAQLRSAIDFLEEVAARFGSRAPKIAEVHLDPALGLSFVEAGDDLLVVVGHPPYEAALDRLSRVKTALREKNVKASRIMLGGPRRKDRAVARLVGGGGAGAVSGLASR
jgi:cell division protein FtsQ